MKSSPKYFIMWICKALSAAPSCHSFLTCNRICVGGMILNVRQICVQRLCKAQSTFSMILPRFPDSVQAHPTMDAFCSPRKETANGHLMLNVQFSRPFHVNYCSSNFNQNRSSIELSQELKKPDEGSLSVYTKELYEIENAASQADFDNAESDEEDISELKKEAVWNVGPTPAASFTFAAYANDSDIIQKLVQLGVDLSRVERKYNAIPFLLKLDYEKDITPTLRFLTDNGVDPDSFGWYFTKNPFLFQENLANLEKRLDYLRLKRFAPEAIYRIINSNPFWLSFSITRIDKRLGFFQSFFRLSGSQVRELVVSGPKLITGKLERVKDVTFKVKEEMGFTPDEVVQMLLAKPKIWRERPDSIWRRFDYLHNTVKFPHAAFVLCPELLLVRERRLKHRIGFLEHVGKAQFDPAKPNYVSFKMIYEGDDSEFSKVAKSSVLEFNEYMKSM